MDSHPKWRARARAALEAYLRRRSSPRFTLFLLVTIAGLAGLVISRVLLDHGIEEMWLRYPLAVIGAYATFLVQLRIWVEIERATFDPKQLPLDEELTGGSPKPGRSKIPEVGDSWLDWLDVPGSFDFGEGCAVGCLFALIVGALAGVAGLLISTIMAGSEILAEVLLDAFVVTMLYRHLKTAAKEHWLGTAVRRTWISALLIAAGLSLAGACLGVLAPNSHSFGKALKEIFSGGHSK